MGECNVLSNFIYTKICHNGPRESRCTPFPQFIFSGGGVMTGMTIHYDVWVSNIIVFFISFKFGCERHKPRNMELCLTKAMLNGGCLSHNINGTAVIRKHILFVLVWLRQKDYTPTSSAQSGFEPMPSGSWQNMLCLFKRHFRPHGYTYSPQS